jgi:predicted Zn-dependent protease
VKLENRLPAEGINSSHEHPLQEFAWLVGGAIATVVVVVIAASYAARWIAPHVPFRYEQELVRGLDFVRPAASEDARAVQDELQALAERLGRRMSMPAGIRIRVGYNEGATVNAFATLGGQAVFFRGLLERLDSEDALAAVMAHELAHLKHRHPAAALGRGVAVGLVLSLVSAELGRSFGGSVLSQAGVVTVLTFSRDQEREADAEALRTLAAEYGHVGGALDLFAALAQQRPGATALAEQVVPEFMRTHPMTAARVESVRDWAQAHGKPADGARRPLPPAIAALAREAGRATGTEQK